MTRSAISLTLIDRDEHLVRAWEAQFRGLPVTVLHGDVFEQSADAVVAPSNSFGQMDSGLEAKLRALFGRDVEDRIRDRIRDEFFGELLVGQAIATRADHPRFTWVITAPTMRHPSEVRETINAYLAMRAVLRVARATEDIATVLCTGMCARTGQMPPARVARQMRAAFDRVMYGAYGYTHWRYERDFEGFLRGARETPPAVE